MRKAAASVLVALTAALCGFGWANLPANAATISSVYLAGVSCATAKFCMAVGIGPINARGVSGPFALAWNGAKWRQVAVQQPAGTNTFTPVELNGVSCRSAAYCVAVGTYGDDPGARAFAETWNGRTWKTATLPEPTGPLGALDTFGNSVSCWGVGHCVAVGSYSPSSRITQPLVETLAGTKWSMRHGSVPAGARGGDFGGVSCLSATLCVLGGQYITAAATRLLFESWNGKAFTRMKAGATPGITDVLGLSCSTAKNCAAVAETIGTTVTGFTEVWNGTAWRAVTVHWPSGTRDSRVNGISCAAGKCLTAGETTTATSGRASSASYDGRAWALTNVPPPGRGDVSLFTSVNCPSATDCVAVGWLGPQDGTAVGLIGSWNGKSWKLVQVS